MTFTEQLNRILDPVRTAIKQMARKAIVDTVDDTGAQQVISVRTGGGAVLDKVERLQPFGLTSAPASGDEVLLISTNGDREHAVAVQVGSSANRISGLDEGEVAVYRNASNKIVFRANGDLEIMTEGQLSINGGNLTVESA